MTEMFVIVLALSFAILAEVKHRRSGNGHKFDAIHAMIDNKERER